MKTCTVEGCCKPLRYPGAGLCQMHYFRRMRRGTCDPRKLVDRLITPNGYVTIRVGEHPLSRRGWIFEHRFVAYEKYGEALRDCELCGRPVDWRSVHIDHINRVRTDNRAENLRPLCRGCNCWRDHPRKRTRELLSRHQGNQLLPELPRVSEQSTEI